MQHVEGGVRSLLKAVQAERRALEKKRELFDAASAHLRELEAQLGADATAGRNSKEALACLRLAINEVHCQRTREWSKRLDEWAGALEELTCAFDSLVDLATLGELSASVAHEIRNPLCGILLSVEVLQTKMDPADSRNILLNNLRREAEKMEKVVSNLLHFARHYQPRPVVSEMGEVVLRTIESIKSHLQKQRIEVRVRRSAIRCEAEVDPDLVQQVFRNILLNSVDASPKGSRLDVDLGLAEDGAVAIAFIDRGEGIRKDRIDRIFDPFFTSKTNGVGLGLSVSKKIVDAHHGRIEVESEPGRGSRFTVVLPRKAELQAEMAAA